MNAAPVSLSTDHLYSQGSTSYPLSSKVRAMDLSEARLHSLSKKFLASLTLASLFVFLLSFALVEKTIQKRSETPSPIASSKTLRLAEQ